MSDRGTSIAFAVKILVVGDMHFSKRSASIIGLMTERILAYIKKYKPDHVVFLGDTLDRFRSIDSLRQSEAVEFFYQCSLICSLTLLIGNHDIEMKDKIMSRIHGFVALTHYWPINVVDAECIEFQVKGMRFQAVPYCPNGRFKEGLATITNKTGDPIATFCHQEIEGCDTGRRILTGGGDNWVHRDGLLIAGHIHFHKWMKNKRGDTYAVYTGSPYQDNIDEAGDKTISLFTFSHNSDDDNGNPVGGRPGYTWSEERISLGLPVKLALTMSYREYRKMTIDDSTIYFLTVEGTSSNILRIPLMEKTDIIKTRGGKITPVNTSRTDKTVHVNTTVLRSLTLKEAVCEKIKEREHLSELFADVFRD